MSSSHPSRLPSSLPQTPRTPTQFLTEENSRNHLVHAWPARQKWILLTVISFYQTSTAFNAASYSNTIPSLKMYFDIDNAEKGIAAFLISHALVCRLWRPFSEEMGRKSVTQASLSLTNVSVLVWTLSKTFGGVIGGRIMVGLSSAGGCVTMSIIEDMFDKDEQHYSIFWASLFTCLGAVLAGVAGGAIK